MNPELLSRELITLSPADTILFISENRNAIRTMFLKEWDSKDNKTSLELVLKTMCAKGFSSEQEGGIEVQSLFVHLAYYFKRVNIPAYLTTCYSKITNPYFKLRLEARMKYKKYHTFNEHIQQFRSYLELLSAAQDEIDDGNYNELLNDLNEYVEYANERLADEYKEELHKMLEDEKLQEEFPLLNQFQEKKASKVPGLEVIAYNGNEFEPTNFALALFDEKFMSEIKRRSQPDYPKMLMGYSSKDVRYDIIGRGQADFDEKYKTLDASDRVNLYCYFNMRMHFFSSLSLYQRSKIFDKYYTTSGRVKFIDLGCGPATSGLAFADYLHTNSTEDVVFDYYGIDIADNMLKKADDILTNEIFNVTNVKKFYKSIDEISLDELKEASCIVINCCYVFASSSLPFEKIAKYINELSLKYPYIPKYILYQNATEESLNRTYMKFKDLLNEYTIEWTGNEEIRYHNQQNSFYDPKIKEVYYEILQLS